MMTVDDYHRGIRILLVSPYVSMPRPYMVVAESPFVRRVVHPDGRTVGIIELSPETVEP